jgi:hypothetical protein
MQLRAEQLEQELKRVNELKEEQRKNRNANELLTSVSAGKANHP